MSYQAYCTTCGWEGRSFDNKRDATTDGDEHEINAADVFNIHEHHRTEVRSSL